MQETQIAKMSDDRLLGILKDITHNPCQTYLGVKASKIRGIVEAELARREIPTYY